MGGLIQARNLQRAADAPAGARRHAIDEFLRLWHSEIREHFDDEERLLLPLTSSDELRDRLLSEHRVLRDLAAGCERDPDAAAAAPETMRRLGQLLHDHIRWEERVYFETIQREHPEALAALESEAARLEEQRPGSSPRRKLDWHHGRTQEKPR